MKNFNFKLPTVAAYFFCLSLLFTTTSKAQDDPNCGILVDGILAESITSWELSDLSVVFPMKQAWTKYDLIEGEIFLTGTQGSDGKNWPVILFQFKPEDLGEYADAKYVVYNILTKKLTTKITGNDIVLGGEFNSELIKKLFGFYYYCNDCKEGGEYNTKPKNSNPEIYLVLEGHKITSYLETYQNNTKVKQPLYDGGRDYRGLSLVGFGELLYETKHIPYKICYCSYDKKTLKKLTSTNIVCDECKIDYSKQSVQPGKKFTLTIEKVDFNGRFGKIKSGGSNNNGSGNITINNTVVVKNEVNTSTKTTSTNVNKSTGALTASALKPLDKSKAGYFSEKDGNVVIKEGYKNNDDVLNGEMRIYNSTGKLVYIKNYVNDIQTGYSAEYYENGQLMVSGMLNANGDKDGDWKNYDEKGKLTKTEKYKSGELQN